MNRFFQFWVTHHCFRYLLRNLLEFSMLKNPIAKLPAQNLLNCDDRRCVTKALCVLIQTIQAAVQTGAQRLHVFAGLLVFTRRRWVACARCHSLFGFGQSSQDVGEASGIDLAHCYGVSRLSRYAPRNTLGLVMVSSFAGTAVFVRLASTRVMSAFMAGFTHSARPRVSLSMALSGCSLSKSR